MPDPLEQLRSPDDPVAPREEFRWVLRRRIVDALGVDPARIPVDPADLTALPQEATTMNSTTTIAVTAITPYLTVHDAAAAIAFYTDAFGAVEEFRMPGPDGKLMHACVRIGDSQLMLVDEFPEHGSVGPKALNGSPVTIHHFVEDVDAVVKRAEAAGARVTMPPTDMFWGDRYATLEDPFGHRWSVATHQRDLTPEQIAEEMSKAGG